MFGATMTSPFTMDDEELWDEIKPQPYSLQTKTVVLSVFEYLRERNPEMRVGDVERETATATGVSVRSIQRMKKASKEGNLRSPSKKKVRAKTVLDSVDMTDEDRIRREVFRFYSRREIPILETVLEMVKQPPVSFSGGKTSLLRFLNKIGLRCRRLNNLGKHILLEKDDIAAARCKYLRILLANRSSESPRPEIFVAEACVDRNGGDVRPVLRMGKGEGYVAVHGGGAEGFVPRGLLVFKARNGSKGEGQDRERVRQWFEEQLLPNIPTNSIIVVNATFCHSKVVNKAPVTSSKKEEVLEWLTHNDIAHDASLSKQELLITVRRNHHRQVYETDAAARDRGHEVLRLPPHHCSLNPAEKIWSRVKVELRTSSLDRNNKSAGTGSVEEAVKRAVEKVDAETWRECIRRIQDIEDQYRQQDKDAHDFLENFTVELDDASSEEEDEEEL